MRVDTAGDLATASHPRVRFAELWVCSVVFAVKTMSAPIVRLWDKQKLTILDPQSLGNERPRGIDTHPALFRLLLLRLLSLQGQL